VGRLPATSEVHVPPGLTGVRKLAIWSAFVGVSDGFYDGFSLLCSCKIIHSNGPWYMPSGPIPPDPGRDEDPRLVPPWPEWMDDPAYLAGRAGDEDPAGGLDLDQDPEDAPPPDADPGELAAEAERIAGDLAREAAVLAGAGLTAAVAADAAAAAGSGDARVGAVLPGGVCQPGVGVRAGYAAGCRAGVYHVGAVRGTGGRGR
jgi:hypothetical protein